MKLQIYGSKKSEPIIRLRLVPEGEDVVLIAVDAKGSRVSAGCLLTICVDGKFRRPTSVNSKLGFKLDKDGCIKVEEY